MNFFIYFFSSEWGFCVKRKPEIGETTYSVDVLPGKEMSSNEQCRLYFRHQYPEASACNVREYKKLY